MLWPSKRIAPGWQRVLMENEGRMETYTLDRETSTELCLKKNGRTECFPKGEIEYQLVRTSDMPDGLADDLEAEEFADLMAYVRSLR